ncbi:MAG: hypothetical protein FD143_3560, partial [Ignavibacteria bacterium]
MNQPKTTRVTSTALHRPKRRLSHILEQPPQGVKRPLPLIPKPYRPLPQIPKPYPPLPLIPRVYRPAQYPPGPPPFRTRDPARLKSPLPSAPT